jgi:hypothetical protein
LVCRVSSMDHAYSRHQQMRVVEDDRYSEWS